MKGSPVRVRPSAPKGPANHRFRRPPERIHRSELAAGRNACESRFSTSESIASGSNAEWLRNGSVSVPDGRGIGERHLRPRRDPLSGGCPSERAGAGAVCSACLWRTTARARADGGPHAVLTDRALSSVGGADGRRRPSACGTRRSVISLSMSRTPSPHDPGEAPQSSGCDGIAARPRPSCRASCGGVAAAPM
jgi:hypothetical protein